MYIFEFLTLAFPKAGLQLMGIPFTISMFFFLFVLYKYKTEIFPALGQIKGLTVSYAIVVFSSIIVLLFNLDQVSAFQLTSLMVVIGSPLAIAIGRMAEPAKALEILAYSLIIVGGYAIIQWFFGIISTAIPGLTFTFGQDLTTKPIGYGASAGAEAQKMPSTYQNGNGAGLFYALAIPIILTWVTKYDKLKLIKSAAIICGIAGLALSGSRAILIPFVLLFVFLMVNFIKRMKYRNQVLFLSCSLFTMIFGIAYVFIASSQFIQQAYQRYIVQTLSDPTGGNRTTQYELAFDEVYAMEAVEFLRFLFIGLPWDLEVWTEGVGYLLFTNGVIGCLGFVFMLSFTLLGIYKRNKLWSIGFMCVFAAFLVDSSFLFPPALMNFFLLAGILTKPQSKSQSIGLSSEEEVKNYEIPRKDTQVNKPAI